jgi:hypothetical protein
MVVLKTVIEIPPKRRRLPRRSRAPGDEASKGLARFVADPRLFLGEKPKERFGPTLSKLGHRIEAKLARKRQRLGGGPDGGQR